MDFRSIFLIPTVTPYQFLKTKKKNLDRFFHYYSRPTWWLIKLIIDFEYDLWPKKYLNIIEMTPKADLSCRKTYETWYYIIFYFKNELRYYIYLFSWSFWRPFWIWPLEVTRGHAHFVCDGFKNTMPIPNNMPNFKNLSPSAQLLQILGFPPPLCENYEKNRN